MLLEFKKIELKTKFSFKALLNISSLGSLTLQLCVHIYTRIHARVCVSVNCQLEGCSSNSNMLLRFSSPRDLVKMKILVQYVWDRPEILYLKSSQVMLVLLFHGFHLNS